VTLWAQIFLGVIAVATLTMAVIQVGILIAAARAGLRVKRLIDRLEQELQPTFGHLNAIGRDASKVVAVTTAQVERVDRIVTEHVDRLDHIVAEQVGRADRIVTGQVERADRLFTELAGTAEHTVATVHASILAPIREGKALMSGVRAAFDFMREARRRPRTRMRSEDEDALFI